jgi:preprotein translocase subunit SecG
MSLKRRQNACYTDEVVIAILLTVVHVVVCFFLIIVILLQSGKAADLAGRSAEWVLRPPFGPRGSATLLSKATTVSIVLFMLTSMSLSIIATKRRERATARRSSAIRRDRFRPPRLRRRQRRRRSRIAIGNCPGLRRWRNWQTH